MTYVIGHLLLPRYAPQREDSSAAGRKLLGYDNDGGENCRGYTSDSGHAAVVRFYQDVLGMETVFGGEDASFSSLRAKDGGMPILNLEQGHSVPDWGRMIFYVADVDAFWEYLRGKEFNPEKPRDAAWGERYFHMPDPDGHELSVARPI
jgi:catechol 2,3-dioxygenase-like lactoylglutathione lyase family enzyme